MAAGPAISPSSSVIDALRAIPGVSSLSNFSQIGYRPPRFTSGVCRGACLDWIRRVLNATPEEMSRKQIYNTEKRERRLATMADTHATIMNASHERTRLYEADKASLNTRIKEHQEAVNAYNQLPDASEAEESRLASDLQTLQHEKARLTDISNQGAMEVIWSSFAADWKKNQRQLRQKDRRRTFDKIKIVSDQPKTDIADIGASIDRIMALEFFAPSGQAGCMLFAFEYSEEANDAHAIAIHRLNTGAFQFFDPNYGVYSTGHSTVLKECLNYLIGRVYPSQGKVPKAYTVTIFS
jgi:hypothetical protein